MGVRLIVTDLYSHHFCTLFTHNLHGEVVLTGKHKDGGCSGEGAIEKPKGGDVCPTGVECVIGQ